MADLLIKNKMFTLCMAVTVAMLIPAVGGAQKIYRTTVAEDYQKAKGLFDQNKITQAKAAWSDILVNRAYELSSQQKKGLTDRITQCNKILLRRQEASTTDTERALKEITKAKPLLKATMPLEVAEKEKLLKKALAYLEKGTAQEKKTAEHHVLVAHCLINIGAPQKALSHINKAIGLAPSSIDALNLKAQYYYQSQKLDDCLAMTEKSLNVDKKNNTTAWYWMVKALLDKGDKTSFRKAWKNMKRAIGNDSSVAQELSNLMPTQKHRAWLENYGRELANAKAKREKELTPVSGPSVLTIKGGDRKG